MSNGHADQVASNGHAARGVTLTWTLSPWLSMSAVGGCSSWATGRPAFGAFWMRTAFRAVPGSIAEAATIDGATSWSQLW